MKNNKFKNRPNKSYNIGDKIVWESRSVAIVFTVLFYIEDMIFVLMVKRGTGVDDQPNKWCLPCGYLDYDENGIEATERELYEETGLTFDDLKKSDTYLRNDVNFNFLNIKPWDINTSPNENRQNVVLHYGVKIHTDNNGFSHIINTVNTKNSEPNEIQMINLVNIRNLDGYEIAFNHDKIIKKYLDI